MITAKPEIKVGQTWERVSDGTCIVIGYVYPEFDDVRYHLLNGTRFHAIYAWNLVRRYRLIEDVAP